MLVRTETIENIPALVWGRESDRVYIHVHGKMSRKEYAESFAVIAEKKGFQTVSFDLAQHGERAERKEICDIWTGMRDLDRIAEYVFQNWKHVSLYASSLGAYFALRSYAERKLEKCLFQSPIVDMRWLVEHMMLWSGVTEEDLARAGEIETPVDTLRWGYYQYILSHPVSAWPFKTSILYAGKDTLQPLTAMRSFCEKFGAELTISENSQHPFMEPEDASVVEKWLWDVI